MKELREGEFVEVDTEECYIIEWEIRRNCVLAASDESETLASTTTKRIRRPPGDVSSYNRLDDSKSSKSAGGASIIYEVHECVAIFHLRRKCLLWYRALVRRMPGMLTTAIRLGCV